MAAPPRLITLNIGSQTIGLAEFRIIHGRLVLVNCRFHDTPLDPETGQRRDAHAALHETAVALREMMSEMHIHRASVNYAVPAQSVFARFVKLPGLEAEKIDKIISFEAQQNVPFPLDQVVWDYQVVGGGMGEQIQVVIVAIKRDLLDEINNVVEETGLRTSIVGVASMALYNAFCYNYTDLNGCSMLVDIGARTTNVLFIESGRIFLRSVPLGGSTITAAIAREFNEPFAAAEARRKRDGFVALGGAAEPADSVHLFGELVGLALRSVTVCPMELNLLPASVVQRQDLEKRRTFFITSAACILLALLGWSAYYTRAAHVAQQTAQAMGQKNDSMHVAEGQLDKLKKRITALDNVATPLITAVSDRNFWPQILEELNARLPEADIWITELAATSGGKLLGAPEKRGGEIAATPPPTVPPAQKAKAAAKVEKSIDGIMVRGLYLYNPKQQEIVVDYLRNLANSPMFVVNAKTPERVIKSNSVPNDTEWAFPYELQLTLRKPVKLP